MTLPKDIEEAIAGLETDLPMRKNSFRNLRDLILRALKYPAPTQRQRYKEAALQGLIAYRKDDGWPPDTAAQYAGQYADECLAEDAEHAKKESTK